MNTRTAVIAGGVLLLSAAVVASQDALARYEEPAYTVLESDGAIEIRHYRPALVAEVTLNGSDTRARDDGFRVLAAYIFGKNKSRTKLEMTAPVLQQSGRSEKIGMTVPVLTRDSDARCMVFYMPSRYTLESIPQPEDPRIRLRIEPERTVAVVRFSGLSTDSHFNKQLRRIRNFISERHLVTLGEPNRAFYNAPWTLPPLRRNEIMIPVDYRSTS